MLWRKEEDAFRTLLSVSLSFSHSCFLALFGSTRGFEVHELSFHPTVVESTSSFDTQMVYACVRVCICVHVHGCVGVGSDLHWKTREALSSNIICKLRPER